MKDDYILRNQHYISFMDKVMNLTAKMPSLKKQEIIKELNSHIYEAFYSEQLVQIEFDKRIDYILRKLGDPSDFINVDGSYSLMYIFKYLVSLIKRGSSYLLFLSSVLFLIVGVGLLIAKILYPDNVGLFLKNGRLISVGFVSNNSSYASDPLGYWIIPAILVFVIIFYYLSYTLFRRLSIEKSIKHFDLCISV